MATRLTADQLYPGSNPGLGFLGLCLSLLTTQLVAYCYNPECSVAQCKEKPLSAKGFE